MSDLRFISSDLSPFGARIRIACALKGLEANFELPKGGTGSPEYKEMTPFGRIPGMIPTEGTILVESVALLEYLEDSGRGSPSLRPSDPLLSARMRMIIQLFDHNILAALHGVFTQIISPAPDAEVAKQAFDRVASELDKIVFFFEEGGFAVGKQLTLADVAMAPFAFLMDRLASAFSVQSPNARIPRFNEWWTCTAKIPEIASVTNQMNQTLSVMLAGKSIS